MATLKDWLESHGCTDVHEVEVTIKGTSYAGCRYKQGDVEDRVYLLGERPACYIRSSRTVFTVEGEPFEWFMVGWATQRTVSSAQYAAYHYEGNPSFMLGPWTHGKIDEHEGRPYQRVPATLREAVTA